MKKFTLILISVFMMGSLMAQTGLGPLKSYNYMGSQANALYSQMILIGVRNNHSLRTIGLSSMIILRDMNIKLLMAQDRCRILFCLRLIYV